MVINILSATYASPTKGVDVTVECIKIINGGSNKITVSPKGFGISDPDLNVQKGFTIVYVKDGVIKYRGGVDFDNITLD